MSFWRVWVYTIWIVCVSEKTEAQTSGNDLGYQIEKYGGSPGLYYEQLGETNLYNTEWKTVVYINLEQTDRNTERLGQYITHINQLCRAIEIQNWTDCSHFSTTSREMFKRIKGREKLLRELIGSNPKPLINEGER
jgi:hypothetical protein